MIKQNAVVLARTARSEADSIAKGTKRTIMQILTNWNECVKQSGFMGVYDLPTTGYSRKAQIVADLQRCAEQLDAYCEPNPNASQTVEQQNRVLNSALSRVLDIEEAHTEALEMDKPVNETALYLSGKAFRGQWAMLKPYQKFISIAVCHAEALKMNAALNEAFRIAQVTRAEFYLHNPVFQRDFIAAAHAEALEINNAQKSAH